MRAATLRTDIVKSLTPVFVKLDGKVTYVMSASLTGFVLPLAHVRSLTNVFAELVCKTMDLSLIHI